MRFIKLSLLIMLCAAVARAEEKAEPEAGGAAAPMPRDQREFVEKSSKLTTLANRIESSERQFNELVRAKAEAHSAEEKQRLIKEMVELTKERNKDVDQFNKLKSELAYRYPNQGEHLNRRYQTQTKRSIEELEGVAGLDELLTRTKKVIERKYAPFEEKSEKTVAAPVKPTAHEEEPKKLRLEK